MKFVNVSRILLHVHVHVDQQNRAIEAATVTLAILLGVAERNVRGLMTRLWDRLDKNKFSSERKGKGYNYKTLYTFTSGNEQNIHNIFNILIYYSLFYFFFLTKCDRLSSFLKGEPNYRFPDCNRRIFCKLRVCEIHMLGINKKKDKVL